MSFQSNLLLSFELSGLGGERFAFREWVGEGRGPCRASSGRLRLRIFCNRDRSRGLPGLLVLFLGARDGVVIHRSLAEVLIYLSFFEIFRGSPSSRRVGLPFEIVFIQQVLERLCRGHRSTLDRTALFVHMIIIKFFYE